MRRLSLSLSFSPSPSRERKCAVNEFRVEGQGFGPRERESVGRESADTRGRGRGRGCLRLRICHQYTYTITHSSLISPRTALHFFSHFFSSRICHHCPSQFFLAILFKEKTSLSDKDIGFSISTCFEFSNEYLAIL